MQTTSRKRYWRCLVSGIASNAVKVGSRQFLCIRGPTGADSPGLCFNMFDSYMFLQACGNTLTEVHDVSMRPDYLIKYEHVRPWFWDWKCVTSWNYLKQHFSFGGEHSLPTSLQRSDRFVQWWMTWLCNDGSHCATGKEPLVCIARERCHHKNHHRYSQNFPNIHKLNIESVCNLILLWDRFAWLLYCKTRSHPGSLHLLRFWTRAVLGLPLLAFFEFACMASRIYQVWSHGSCNRGARNESIGQ